MMGLKYPLRSAQISQCVAAKGKKFLGGFYIKIFGGKGGGKISKKLGGCFYHCNLFLFLFLFFILFMFCFVLFFVFLFLFLFLFLYCFFNHINVIIHHYHSIVVTLFLVPFYNTLGHLALKSLSSQFLHPSLI